MLGAVVYYVIYGFILFCFAILLYKLWDRAQSGKAGSIIREPDWLRTAHDDHEIGAPIDPQELKPFSRQYVSNLRSVLANPTAKKLELMGAILANPKNREPQLWEMLRTPIIDAYMTYPIELEVLLETVAKHSDNDLQRFSAHNILACIPAPNSRLRKLGGALAQINQPAG